MRNACKACHERPAKPGEQLCPECQEQAEALTAWKQGRFRPVKIDETVPRQLREEYQRVQALKRERVKHACTALLIIVGGCIFWGCIILGMLHLDEIIMWMKR